MEVEVTHKIDWGSLIALAIIVFAGERAYRTYQSTRKPLSGLDSAECAHSSKVSTEKVRPKTIFDRESLLARHGRRAFLMPDGTPAMPGIPAYPIVTKNGCFHCGLGRAALTRIGQGLNKQDYPESHKRKLESARNKLIKTAVAHNCSWAFASEKRFL